MGGCAVVAHKHASVAEWSIASGCKPDGFILRRFKSCPAHQIKKRSTIKMKKFSGQLIIGIIASIFLGGVFVYFQMNKEVRLLNVSSVETILVELDPSELGIREIPTDGVLSPEEIAAFNAVRFAPPVSTRDILITCTADEDSIVGGSIFVTLEIRMNGEKEKIPKGIGIDGICFSEIHTDKGNGEIHVVNTKPDSDLTLGDFFAVWNKSMYLSGLSPRIFVDDVMVWGARYIENNPIETIEDVILEDGKHIRMEYASKG